VTRRGPGRGPGPRSRAFSARLGTSNDTSYAALVDLDQVVVGRSTDVQVAYSDYAFNADQTAMVIGRFDIQPVNAAATVIRPGIRP
jgi:hypothetical protein